MSFWLGVAEAARNPLPGVVMIQAIMTTMPD